MEETQNGNLKVCNQSSSMLKPSLEKPTSAIETSTEEEENSDRSLSCSEPF